MLPPALAPDHLAGGELAQHEAGAQVDAVHAVEFLAAQRQHVARRQDASVAEKDVQAVEVFGGGGDQALALFVVAHVAVVRQGGGAGFRGDLARRLLAAVEVDVGQRDAGAVLREGQRAGAADSLRRAGHDGGPAFEEPGAAHVRFRRTGRPLSRAATRIPGSEGVPPSRRAGRPPSQGRLPTSRFVSGTTRRSPRAWSTTRPAATWRAL